jgi:hypothetical protein
MSTHTHTTDPLIAFSNAAQHLLTQRVDNAPKNEKPFLKGWLNRVGTYTKTIA